MFTTSCFINKNTNELIDKLKSLGYVTTNCYCYSNNSNYLSVSLTEIIVPYKPRILKNNIPMIGVLNTQINNYIDCDINEKLFLALAAMNDENDYMQLFYDNYENNYFICTHYDIISYLHNKIPIGKFLDYGNINDNNFSISTILSLINEYKDKFISKATKEQIIEYYGNK